MILVNRIALIFFFLVLPLAKLLAQAQPLLISAKYQNVPAQEVILDLKTRYNLRFSYDPGAIEKILVSQEWENELIEVVLENFLEPNNLGYRKVGSTYVIVPLISKDELKDSEEKINFYVTVEDNESGEPLPYAIARMQYPPRVFTANANGEMLLMDIPADSCEISFSYIGYESRTYKIKNLRRERESTVLLKVRSNALPAAVVEAKGLSPVASSSEPGQLLINPQLLGSINGPGEPDVLRTTQLLPGINASNETSNGLIIRGSPGDQSLLKIDGFTIYHMDHFFGVISAINPLSVKNIRVQKGGGEARFASRVGGAVEITAKEGNRYETGGKIVIGPLAISGYLETPLSLSNNASFMISARRSTTDLWTSPTYTELFNTIYRASITSDEASTAGEEAEYRFSDVISKVTWRPTGRDLIFLSGYFSQDQLGIAYSSVDNLGAYSFSYTDNSEWGNRGVGAGWKRRLRPTLNQDVTVGWSRYASDLNAVDTLIDLRFQDTQRIFREDNNVLRDVNLRYQLEWSAKKLTWYAGAMLNQVAIERNNNQSTLLSDSLNQMNLSTLFLQTNGSNRDLNWNAGLRMNHYTATKEFYPEWAFNATYGRQDSILFKGSVSRIHQFVHRLRQQSLFLNQPDTWVLSDQNSMPVLRSDQFMIGVLVPLLNWQIDMEAYLKVNEGMAIDISQWMWLNMSDQIRVVTGNGSVVGFDLFIKRDFGKSDFWIGYSLANTSMSFQELDLQSDLVPGYEHQHELKFYYEIRLKSFNVWANWIFGSGRPYTPYLGEIAVQTPNQSNLRVPVFADINSGRLNPYHRLDGGVTYKKEWNKGKIEVTANFNNIYNRRNIRDIQYLSFLREDGSYLIQERRVEMLGFIPSLQIAYTF